MGKKADVYRAQESMAILQKDVRKIMREIAERRDALRKIAGEINDVLSTLKEGHDSFASGLRDIEDGLDQMSALL